MVFPFVHLFFACGKITIESDSNQTMIQSPLMDVTIPSFPRAVTFEFYFLMTGGVGDYKCRIEVAHESGFIVAKTSSDSLAFALATRYLPYEHRLEMRDWTIDGPGAYECQLKINDRVVAVWPIIVREKDE
jgi:hypothetical protein